MTLTRSVIRRWIQASLLAIGAAGVTQCVDGVGPGRDRSTFRLAPMWSNRASRDLASLGEAGLPLDRVRVVLIRPISDTLKDTTVTVHAGDSQIDLPLTVDVTAGASLRAVLQFKSGETVLFQGETSVQTVLLNRPNPPAVELPIIYVGPGKEATRVDVAPASGTFPANVPITFVATAFDANNLLLANTPFEWAVDDQTMGSFGIGGLFTPSGKDGSVTITATTPTGISGTATVSLVSGAAVGPPASITIISGNAQVDTILKTLANPFVVKVADANGAAVSGVTVTWTRVGGFGTPANATSETDASGLASLVYRLGDIGGADTVHAAVAGVATPAVFTATVHDGLGAPIVTGFAYLRVQPSPATPRLGDTLSLTADSISASGQATRVTAQWASNNPGRGTVDATGRLIVTDTGAIIVTATRNGLIGHARVSVLPAPKLVAFGFAPRTLNGVANSPVTASFTFGAIDAGAGITGATLTLTGPGGTTRTCTFTTPTVGTKHNGVFDCALTLPAGSATGVWHVTNLVLTGSITRAFGESVLALFGPTTLTINP